MDLVSLTILLTVLVGMLGVDTVMHPAGVVLEASIPAKYDQVAVDQDTIRAVLDAAVTEVASTPSVDSVPEMRVGGAKGIGMAVAEALKVKPIALALQYEVGCVPEQVKIAIMGEDGTTKIWSAEVTLAAASVPRRSRNCSH